MLKNLALYVVGTSVISLVTISLLGISRYFQSRGLNETIPLSQEDHPVVGKTFLLMKTGIDVAFKRIPPHIDTTFQNFPHHAVYADSDDTIDGIPMIDCLKYLDNEILNDPSTKAYRLRRQSTRERWNWGDAKLQIPEDPKAAWSLDRYKNLPAFAHAWVHNPKFDWYVMVDADTFLMPSTLEAAVSGRNPNEALYLGRAVGMNPEFAHGGSSIVFSRKAMELMYGKSAKSADERIRKGGEAARRECCGDSLMSRMYIDGTGRSESETLDRKSHPYGNFQGGSIATQFAHFDEWCNALGSFHKLGAWEIEVLYNWQQRMGSSPTYADFYHDFIMPNIAEEKVNWAIAAPEYFSHKRFNENTEEAHKKDSCKKACENEDKCTMWTFWCNKECYIFYSAVAAGSAMNKYNPVWKDEWTEVTSGYMIDRIADARRSKNCNPPSTQEEGWRYRDPTSPGEIALESVKIRTNTTNNIF